jgi:hypothetical protein
MGDAPVCFLGIFISTMLGGDGAIPYRIVDQNCVPIDSALFGFTEMLKERFFIFANVFLPSSTSCRRRGALTQSLSVGCGRACHHVFLQ